MYNEDLKKFSKILETRINELDKSYYTDTDQHKTIKDLETFQEDIKDFLNKAKGLDIRSLKNTPRFTELFRAIASLDTALKSASAEISTYIPKGY